MANLSKLDYTGKYNNTSTGLFKDNTTKDIGADDVRTLVTDTGDSFYNKTDDAHTLIPQFTASGTDTYTATPSPAISAYAAGQTFKILFTNANTGAATINLNGVGAAAITKDGTTALVADDIKAGSIKILSYDGTRFQVIGDGGGGGSGIASEVNFTPAGNLSASNVQAAIEELDSEKAAVTQVIGVQDFNIPAAAMWPRATDGCAPLANFEMATSLLNVVGLRFGLSGQEFAQCHFTLPRKWNNGTITYKLKWKPEASGTGNVRFGVQAAAYGNDDALTGAFGTEVAVTDAFIATDDLHLTDVSGTLTIAGSPQAEDLIAVQINRDPDHTDDTFSNAAILIDITFYITTTSGVDA